MVSLIGTSGNDVLEGSDSNDSIEGLAGDDTLRGFEGNDTLIGGDGENNIYGGSGNDLISSGDSGFGFNFPGEGSDTIIGVQSGDDGADLSYSDLNFAISVNLASGTTTGANTSDTFTGVHRVFGTSFNDSMVGGADDEWEGFDPNKGNDTVDGASGYDEILYHLEDGSSGITLNFSTGTVIDTYGDTDTIFNIEAVRASAHDDMLIGSLSSFESYRGLAGNDTIIGGGGGDRADYSRDASYGGSSGINANLVTGRIVDGFGDIDAVEDIQWVRGTDFSDTIIGNSANERHEGEDGDDFMVGGDGDDELDGDGGNDTIYAGASDVGNDTLRGGDGNDILGAGGGNDDVYGWVGNDTIFGGAGLDSLRGEDGTDVIWAGSDGDQIDGGAGADTMGGGEGADTLNGDDGGDVIYAAAGNDAIDAGEGADEAYGGDGDDTLTGGADGDSLFGGNGNDDFIFELNHGDDFIGGFETRGENVIDLTQLGLNGFSDLIITQTGADTIINTGQGSITLWNTMSSDIAADDFYF